MMLNLFISLLILLCGPAYALEVISSTDNKNISVLNDNFKSLNDSVNKSKNALNDYFGDDNILNTANGGTGADLSTASQDSLIYMSADQVMNTIAPGTNGQILYYNSPPYWGNAPQTPKVVFANGLNADTGSVNTSTVVSTIIDGSGDWSGKSYSFIGTLSQVNSSSGCSVTTDITGSNVSRYSDFSFYGRSYGNGCTGSIGCSIGISGGNLVLSAGYSPDIDNASNEISCSVTGNFIREP